MKHNKESKPPKICPVCKRVFDKLFRKTTIYCSDVCRAKARKEYLKIYLARKKRVSNAQINDSKHEVKSEHSFIYTCLQCKETGTSNRKNRKFCSRACLTKFYSLKNAQKQKEERRKNKSVVCPMCNTSFYPMRKNQVLCYRKECGSGYELGFEGHKKHISYHSMYSNKETEKVSKGSACKIVICSIIDNVRDYLFQKFGMMTQDNIEIFNIIRREYLKKYCSSTTGSRYVMGAALFYVVCNMINKSNQSSPIQAEDIKLAMMEKFGEKTSCCLVTMKKKVNLIIKFINESYIKTSKTLFHAWLSRDQGRSDTDPFGVKGFFKLEKTKKKTKIIKMKNTDVFEKKFSRSNGLG